MTHAWLGLVLGALLAATPARATLVDLTADIHGSQEVPATDSLAFGTGVFQLDTDTQLLSFTILFTAALFDTPEVAAHIHGPAGPGVEADVLFPLPAGALKQGSIDVSANAAADAADLLAGLWYVNIHSDEHSGGEIRGQILPAVPEPGALALLGAAAALLWAERRARSGPRAR